MENTIDSILDNAVGDDGITLDGGITTPEIDLTPPDIESEDWTPFILLQLKEDEKFNGRPTVDGLRRITSLYFGNIVESISEVNGFTGNSCCVTHKLSVIKLDGYTSITVSGVADASQINADLPYSKYPSALAETRAEGRAYKRLLRLKNVLMADEIAKSEEVESEDGPKIDITKINVIDYLCKHHNINLLKLLSKSKEKYRKIEDIPNEAGNKIVKYLNSIQQKTAEPLEDIVGYDRNWRDVYESTGSITYNDG